MYHKSLRERVKKYDEKIAKLEEKRNRLILKETGSNWHCPFCHQELTLNHIKIKDKKLEEGKIRVQCLRCQQISVWADYGVVFDCPILLEKDVK